MGKMRSFAGEWSALLFGAEEGLCHLAIGIAENLHVGEAGLATVVDHVGAAVGDGGFRVFEGFDEGFSHGVSEGPSRPEDLGFFQVIEAEEVHLHGPARTENAEGFVDVVDHFLFEQVCEERGRKDEILGVGIAFDMAAGGLFRLPIGHVGFALVGSELESELRGWEGFASVGEEFGIDIDTEVLTGEFLALEGVVLEVHGFAAVAAADFHDVGIEAAES